MTASAIRAETILSDVISSRQFSVLLGSYPSLSASMSAARAKPGQRTLLELDDFRYVEAPRLFGVAPQDRPMSADDLKLLVEWKLRHGKFRPALLKLVSSNDATAAQSTIAEAVAVHRAQTEPGEAEALGLLVRALRGVGPATASLLLAVHDPDRVLFFSDEAFYWLCCGGDRTATIRYNAFEYRALTTAARQLMARLRVSAVDIEKVAYVIMKQGDALPKSYNRQVSRRKPPPPKRKPTVADDEGISGGRSQRRRLGSDGLEVG